MFVCSCILILMCSSIMVCAGFVIAFKHDFDAGLFYSN